MIKYEQLLKTTKLYASILDDKINNRLGHCYLIISEDELACKGLCQLASRIVVCKNHDCGVCSDCTKTMQNSNSAIYKLQDTKAESVRELIQQSITAVNEGDKKILLIEDFHKIAPNVQNFLLKSLEDPHPQVVFILGTTQASAVLDTIKSRSKKLYLEALDNACISSQLLDMKYSKEDVARSVECCYGNLTKAINILEDKEFLTNYELWVSILSDMQISKQVVDMLSRLKITPANLVKYLDVLEIIIKALLDINIGIVDNYTFSTLRPLAKVFNYATLVNIMEIVNHSRKKIQNNCKPEAIADSLLIGILEVKYKCR